MGSVCRGEPHPFWNDGEPCYRTWLYLLDTVVVFVHFQSDCSIISVTYHHPQWLATSLMAVPPHTAPAGHFCCGCNCISCHDIPDSAHEWKNCVYCTCFCQHSTSGIRPLPTLEQHTYNGRNLQYRLIYDLGWRRNRMARLQNPTNRNLKRERMKTIVWVGQKRPCKVLLQLTVIFTGSPMTSRTLEII